ncbi:hypothetical protein IL60_0211170 [Brucella inopinata BO1]|nr:hypothetical protein IL60_0211170 [Brucella inopinata BO1]
MIGIFAATPGVEHRKAVRRQQVFGVGTRSGRIERRMLHQPHEFAGSAFADRLHTRFHEGEGFLIVGQPFGDEPLHRRRIGFLRQEARIERIAFGLLRFSGRGNWAVCHDGSIWRLLAQFASGQNALPFRAVPILTESSEPH